MAFITLQMSALFLGLVVVAVNALPAPGEETAPILKQINELNLDGSFKNEFQTGNGISVDQVGYQKSAGAEQIQVIEGVDKYTAPDGTPIETVYTADEYGFKAKGAHLPTPPPPPPAIFKALQWLASLPSTPEPL